MPVTLSRGELRRLITLVPGATSVGRTIAFPKAPRDEYVARWVRSSVAPTLTTHGAAAYGLSELSPGPALPAEKTTVTPASCRSFVATFTGSLTSKTVFDEKLQLSTRMP